MVDDNKDAAQSLAIMMRLVGNEVQTAFDGFEALKVAESFSPEIIILDIGMPRMNGYETVKAIRKQPWGKNVTVVALTGWGQEEDRRKSQEAGFDYHLVKPVDLAAINELLESFAQ